MQEFTHDTFLTGNATVNPGTPVPLGGNINFACRRGVSIKANPANSGLCFIGNQDVSIAKGYPLSAGEVVIVPTDNLNKIFITSDTNSQILHYLSI